MSKAKEGAEEKRENGGGDTVDGLPDRVRDGIRARGRRGGAGRESLRDLIRSVTILVSSGNTCSR